MESRRCLRGQVCRHCAFLNLFSNGDVAFRALTLRPIIQLRIVAKYPFLIEGQSPLGRKIRGEPGARGDSVAQRDHSSMFAFLLCHRAGKGVTQSCDHLEERQIDVGNRIADKNAIAVAFQDLLEVIQKLRQTFG